MRSRSPRRSRSPHRSSRVGDMRAWQRPNPMRAALSTFAGSVSVEHGRKELTARVHSFEEDSQSDSHLDSIIQAVAKPLSTFTGTDETKELIKNLAEAVKSLTSSKKLLRLSNIPVLFDALRSHTPCSETQELLLALSQQLDRRTEDEGLLNGWEIAMILCGMRYHKEDPTKRSILACMTRQLRRKRFKFHELAVRFILLGLENFKPSDISRAFLLAFSAQDFDHLNTVELDTVVNALQGLRNLPCVMTSLQIIEMLQKKVPAGTGNVKIAITGLIELQEYPCIPSTAKLLQQFVQVLVQKEKYNPSQEDMCGVLAGLYQHPTSAHSCKLLQQVETWFSDMTRQMAPSFLSGAVWGLANQRSTPESRALLKRLNSFFRYSNGQWTTENILNAMHGLRWHQQDPEVQDLIRFLRHKMIEIPGFGADGFSLKKVAIASRGMPFRLLLPMISQVNRTEERISSEVLISILRSCESEGHSAECDEILSILGGHLDRCGVELEPHTAVGEVLFAFQNISPCEGLQQVFQRLLPCILEAVNREDAKISPKGVARALFGLRNHRELGRECFEVLLHKIQTGLCNEEPSQHLSPDDFRMALLGLDDRIKEGQPFFEIFSILLGRAPQSSGHLTGPAICSAFVGMQTLLDWESFGLLVSRMREREKSDSNIAVLKSLHDMLDPSLRRLSKNDIGRCIEGLECFGGIDASSVILHSLGEQIYEECTKIKKGKDRDEHTDDNPCSLEDVGFEDLCKYVKGLRNHIITTGIDKFMSSLALLMFVLKMRVSIDQARRLLEELKPLKYCRGVKQFVGLIAKLLDFQQACPNDAESRAVQALRELQEER